MKNILNLKINELAVDIAKKINILLKTFNSPSPRSSFFFNPTLLGSPGRTVKML
jgi:hypothetical protein